MCNRIDALFLVLYRRSNGALVIFGRNKAPDKFPVDRQCPPLYCIAEVSFNNRNVTAGNILNGTDVIRITGIITDSRILPIVQNRIARRGNIRIVLNPTSHPFRRFNDVIAANLNRHNRRIAELNRQCRPCCRAPCPTVKHLCSTRETAGIGIVNIDDFFVRAIRLILSNPRPSQIDYRLS